VCPDRIDNRRTRRLYAAQEESERRLPYLAIEDFTEPDEIAPAAERAWKLHPECFDAWHEGKAPCGRCETVLGVRQ